VTLYLVLEDFASRFPWPTLKSKIKTPARITNGQRVTIFSICEITFELARHEFKRNFTSYVI
jgi:hypothetical protein